MIHDLKILPEWFNSVVSGVKTFEIRKDDRNYNPRDVLLLREWDGKAYTGRTCKADVTMVLRGKYCREGYCTMSIRVLNGNEQAAQWIPCSERLPEKDVEVLVAIYGTDYHFVREGETLADAVERDRQTVRTVTVAHLSDEGWNGADWLPLMVLPTYWMPKPEAPDPPKLEKLPECKGMTPKEWREKFQAMLNDDSDEPEV